MTVAAQVEANNVKMKGEDFEVGIILLIIEV